VTTNAPARFQWRAFVTFFVTFSFLLLAASGLVLYVAPPGRVAHWSLWTMGRLDKEAWQGVHTVFAFLFVLAGAFHLYFNWRVFLSYLRSRLAAGVRMKRELTLATSLVAAIGVLTVAGLPPFATVMEVGERARQAWSVEGSEPPVPHAEILPLERLAALTQMPLERVLANLESAGLAGSTPQATIAALASRHGLTPEQVWVALKGEEKPRELAAGGGYGRKTVGEVCAQLEVPAEEGLDRLRRHGMEATPDTPMKALADRHGRQPHDLLRILAGA
jgi:transposase-like protein